MCKYCEDNEKVEHAYLHIQISKGKTLSIWYNAYSCDSSFDTQIPIKYCPFCGRKL